MAETIRSGAHGRAEIRTALAGLWAEVLGVLPGPSDTFSDLGGSSLGVEEVIAQSRAELIVPLMIEDFLGEPTLDIQAQRLLIRYAEGASTASHTLQQLRTGDAPAVFCFSGAGSSAAYFLPVANALNSSATSALAVYGLQAHGLTHRARPSWTVNGAVSRHLREIRTVQPTGPYLLIGHSFGGVLALETARRLRDQGSEVGRVLLLDTVIDAQVALERWSPDQEGYAVGPTKRQPAALALLAGLLRMAGAGWIRRNPVEQKRVFWELGMRAQRRHRIRSTDAALTVLLTRDAPGQESLWRAAAPHADIVSVPGGHLSMVTEPTVLSAIDDAIATA